MADPNTSETNRDAVVAYVQRSREVMLDQLVDAYRQFRIQDGDEDPDGAGALGGVGMIIEQGVAPTDSRILLCLAVRRLAEVRRG
jgi:hypothetical protein